MIRSTPGIFCGPVGSALRDGLRSGGAFVVVCAVRTMATVATPSSALICASASSLSCGIGCGVAAADFHYKAHRAVSDVSALTIPASTIDEPLMGSLTPARTRKHGFSGGGHVMIALRVAPVTTCSMCQPVDCQNHFRLELTARCVACVAQSLLRWLAGMSRQPV